MWQEGGCLTRSYAREQRNLSGSDGSPPHTPPPRAPDTRAFRLSGSPGCRARVLVWSLGGANARAHSWSSEPLITDRQTDAALLHGVVLQESLPAILRMR